MEIIDGADDSLQLFDKANAFLVMYWIDSVESFQEAKRRLQLIKKHKMDDWNEMMLPFHLIICGNKMDLGAYRQVPYKEGAALGKEWNCSFVETSAKMVDANVSEPFYQLARMFMDSRNSKDIDNRRFSSCSCMVL